jgi:AraC-like DNA-binding protein
MFKKHVGVSPIQFTVNRRIDRAKLLLARPDFTISSVAIRTGFSDLSEFNKQFKRITGITPSAYRKSA